MRRPPLPSEPFTTATAAQLGYDSKHLTRLVEEGRLQRPFTGVYLTTDACLTVELRAQAARLVMNPSSVLCDRTAAWLWGVDVFTPAERDVTPRLESFVLRGNRPTRRLDCHGRTRDLAPQDWVDIGGVLVTTPLRTALDLACNLTPRDALAAMDALARDHHLTRAELERTLRRFRRRRGVVQARRLVPLVDPRAESPPESWVRLILAEHGLPAPVLQHWVERDGVPTYRLDLAWPHAKVAVEYDGEQHHSSAEDRRRDQARRAWLRERGWYVVVVTKAFLSGAALEDWVREVRDELSRRTCGQKRFCRP